jgi:phosphoserine phosphatase
MTARHPVVFLVDVDNTLVDNDRIAADLKRHLEREVGHERQERYWAIFEELRAELGYADYLGALQRYRVEYPRDPHVLTVSSFMVNYPFANRLYPNSLDVLERFRSRGPTVILSDGDAVFQPRKIERSGIRDAVDGNVLIYIHKDRELDDVEQRYPVRSLRAGRRQAAYPDGREAGMGPPSHDGLPGSTSSPRRSTSCSSVNLTER